MQGPNARAVLGQVTDADVDGLGFFRLTPARIDGFDATITRTGYTGADGYELYLQVREKYPQTPVLMMTAFHYDKDHIIKRSRMEGLEGVIFKKPVDPDRLRRTIIESVEKS